MLTRLSSSWGQDALMYNQINLMKSTTEDEMAGWHHRLNEHEFE